MTPATEPPVAVATMVALVLVVAIARWRQR